MNKALFCQVTNSVDVIEQLRSIEPPKLSHKVVKFFCIGIVTNIQSWWCENFYCHMNSNEMFLKVFWKNPLQDNWPEVKKKSPEFLWPSIVHAPRHPEASAGSAEESVVHSCKAYCSASASELESNVCDHISNSFAYGALCQGKLSAYNPEGRDSPCQR